MRKDFGPKSWVYPAPVLMIGTYDEANTPNIMNAAWGAVFDYNVITISLSEHKTTKNIELKHAFTVRFATKSTVKESDYFGIESGAKVNKVEKAGFNAFKSSFVDAPLFKEYPLSLECELISFNHETGQLLGKIVNVSADEKILTDGNIDVTKLEAIVFDPFTNSYVIANEKVAQAFKVGMEIKNRK